MEPSLCPSLSVLVSLSVSECLTTPPSLSLAHCVSHYMRRCLPLSISVSYSVPLSLSVSMCLTLSVSLCILVSTFLCVSVSLSMPLSISLRNPKPQPGWNPQPSPREHISSTPTTSQFLTTCFLQKKTTTNVTSFLPYVSYSTALTHSCPTTFTTSSTGPQRPTCVRPYVEIPFYKILLPSFTDHKLFLHRTLTFFPPFFASIENEIKTTIIYKTTKLNG